MRSSLTLIRIEPDLRVVAHAVVEIVAMAHEYVGVVGGWGSCIHADGPARGQQCACGVNCGQHPGHSQRTAGRSLSRVARCMKSMADEQAVLVLWFESQEGERVLIRRS